MLACLHRPNAFFETSGNVCPSFKGNLRMALFRMMRLILLRTISGSYQPRGLLTAVPLTGYLSPEDPGWQILRRRTKLSLKNY